MLCIQGEIEFGPKEGETLHEMHALLFPTVTFGDICDYCFIVTVCHDVFPVHCLPHVPAANTICTSSFTVI